MSWDNPASNPMEDIAEMARRFHAMSGHKEYVLKMGQRVYDETCVEDFIDDDGFLDWDRALNLPENVHVIMPPTRVETYEEVDE